MGDDGGGARAPFTGTELAICAIAAIGFAFDIYELLMLPLVMPPALQSMGFEPGTPAMAAWRGRLFWWPAIAGGVFGLLGGYLTDAFGRRKVLTWSIMLYAVSAAASAFVTAPVPFLLLRCATFVGVCVEFVAAVAWLAEVFPEPRRRETVLGWTQAFSSFGGLMVTGVYGFFVTHAPELPAILGEHAAWRYTLLSGLIPALPLLLVRPFLPESPVWKKKRDEGTLKRPRFGELFAPGLLRTTVVTTLMVGASYAVAYGALQQLPAIVPGIPELKGQTKAEHQLAVSAVQLYQELGGLVGRVLLALLALHIASRRTLVRLFLVPGLVIVPFVFWNAASTGLETTKLGVFASGVCVVAVFSFWGNYLPLVFPLHLRGTGEGFSANVGGRMLGTSAGWLTATVSASPWLAELFPLAPAPQKIAVTAAVVACAAFAFGLVASFWLPEPGRELRED